MVRFSIPSDEPVGDPPTVVLNGAKVVAETVHVILQRGQLPRLVVELPAEAGEELLGDVDQVEVVRDLDQRQVVERWLAGLDPETVNREVLEGLGYGAGPPPVETLAYLRRLVAERDADA